MDISSPPWLGQRRCEACADSDWSNGAKPGLYGPNVGKLVRHSCHHWRRASAVALREQVSHFLTHAMPVSSYARLPHIACTPGIASGYTKPD